MSISAIATGKQNCQADIKWLHQCYILDTAGTAFCVLEFIVEIKKGSLNYLDLYLPYGIDKLKDRTLSLLDEKNKYFYTEGFKVISINKENAKCGEIVLDGIKTGIGEVSLEHAPTNLGSKVTINFSKAIHSGESMAIRMEFDCKNLSSKLSEEKHSLTLTYYDFNAAKFLSLDKAVNVSHLFVWIVFPYGADSMSNITPPFFQQRTWDSIDLNRVETFYGSRTKSIWSCMPRTLGLWVRHIDNKEQALRTGSSLYLNCDYIVRKSTFREKPREGKPEYEVWVSDKGSEGCIVSDRLTKEGLIQKFEKLKQKHSFLLDDRYNAIYVNKEKINAIKIARRNKKTKKIKYEQVAVKFARYKLLLWFLEHKDSLFNAERLYRVGWSHIWGDMEATELPMNYQDSVKNEISILNAVFKAIGLDKNLKIESERLLGYRCVGDCDYCLIVKSEHISLEQVPESHI